ncbi:MAG TPA: 50S ribosomal protein L24, partial [Chthonomonadales bacterium]|nr:50S ribosomal protein L24 [Chthonomonadales bacterium]
MRKWKRSIPEAPVKLKMKKGDTVHVISGKDIDKRGEIIAAYPKVNKVLVRGINMMVKHIKDRPSNRPGISGSNQIIKGGRVEKEAPLFACKLMVVCPACKRPTRIGYEIGSGVEKQSRRKFRVCKHPDCGKR